MKLQATSIRIAAAGLLLLTVTGARVNAEPPADGSVYVRLDQAVKRLPTGTSLGANVLMIVDPETTIRVDTNQGGAWSGGGPPGHGGGSFFNPAFAAPDPDTLSPIEALALKYSRNVAVYGHIGALVPRVMTILNMPDSLDRSNLGIPIEDAERLFVDSLDDDRWKSLLGKGLAVNDLNDDQRALFANMLARAMDVVPTSVARPSGTGDQWKQTDQAYYESVKHLEPEQVQAAQTLHASFAGHGPVDYQIVTSASRGYATGADPLAQVAVAVPNALKDSALGTEKVTATVKLKPKETVGEIVTAIAAATGFELYCDKRYVDRRVSVDGDLDHPIEAADLMKALRMSLAATWRKVGPVYVLTDDIAGYASRRRAIAGSARVWTDRIRHDLDKANRDIAARAKDNGAMLHFSLDLPDPGSVGLDDIPCTVPISSPSVITATFATDPGRGFMPPSIDEPLTAADAKSTVDGDVDSGNRSVYIKAFHGGKAYFDSKALPSADTSAVLPSALDEAKVKGVKLYAVVDLLRWSPASDASGKHEWTSIASEDTTVDGRTASQALTSAVASGIIDAGSPVIDPAGGDWVSPGDPKVKEVITGIARELASTPDLAGIVLADTIPPGYDGERSPLRAIGVDLGYSESMRLAYLRDQKEDPIDLDDPADGTVILGPRVATLDVLGFGSLFKASEDVKPWIEFRHACALKFVTDIVDQIHKTAPTLPVYIETTPGGPIAPWTAKDVTTASR